MRTSVLRVAAALLALWCCSRVFDDPTRRPMYSQGKKIMTEQVYGAHPYGVTGAHQSSPPAVEFNATRQTDPTSSGDAHLYLPKNANGGFVPYNGYAASSSAGPYDGYYQNSAHGTSSLDWGPGRECLSSFSPPPSAETYYQNPTAIHGVAYHWSAADARRFDGLPVVGIASALYQRAPTTTENQAVNAPSQQFLSSHPVAAHVQQSLTSYAHPSAYAGEPSINGSPALNSGSIGHGMGGSVMYPPVSSPGIMYDGGITAERSFRMRMFGGVPRPDQASNEDALSERLPSADIAQSASPLGLDATPGRRRRGRDELAISRRRKAPGQFACPHCTTATFTTKAAREKHIESLHLNKVYRCGIDGCPKEYSHQASLDRHRRDTHDISKKRYGGAVD